MRFVLLRGYIGHQQALVHVHLGRRQPDAGGLVHGLEHVVDQLPELIVHMLHRGGFFPQPRVRKFENSEFCHSLGSILV